MKKLIYFLLIVTVFGCKREERFFPKVDPLLIGKWELLAHEQTLSDGTKEWRILDFPSGEPELIVRSDGALLNGNGEEYCCISYEKYVVNGEVYFPKLKTPIPYNRACAAAYCAICDDHEFQVDGDEMIWTHCGSRSRYRRLP